MVSDPGPGVGDEQFHLHDPDPKPVQLRQVGPARQDPLTEFCSSVSELFEPGKEVRVFHARRGHPFDVRITAIMEKLTS